MSFLFLASGANAVSKLDALFILTLDPPTTGLVPKLTVVTGLAWGQGLQSLCVVIQAKDVIGQ